MTPPTTTIAAAVRELDARLAFGVRDSLRRSDKPEVRKAFRAWVRKWRPIISQIDYIEHLSQG